MSDTPNEGSFSLYDLRAVVDPTPVEHFGGPDDGEFLPASSNGLRSNGMYVVVSRSLTGGRGEVAAKRFLPIEFEDV